MSSEALEDAFGLAEWLTLDVGRQMAEEEDVKFYSSSGLGPDSEMPFGFERGATTLSNQPIEYYVPTVHQMTVGGGDWADETYIDYVHMEKMFAALPLESRVNAAWMGGSIVEQAILSMRAGPDADGSPMFPMMDVPSATAVGAANLPGMNIFGRPFIQMPGIQSPNRPVLGNSNRLYFVDMRRSYAILESGEIRASRSGSSSFATDSTDFRFIDRVDGSPFEVNTSDPAYATNDYSRSSYVYTSGIIEQGDASVDPSP
jgi:HK97 family phage major capsid protein